MNKGIYLLYCLKTNRVYIGQSKNIKARIESHFGYAFAGYKNNLCEDIRKYGRDYFITTILELAEDDKYRTMLEMEWIDLFRKKGHNLYNKTCGGETHGPRPDKFRKELKGLESITKKQIRRLLRVSRDLTGISANFGPLEAGEAGGTRDKK